MEVNSIIEGDCIEEMKKLEDNSVDAIITDPPYGLEFMGKEWDSFKDKGQGDGWQVAGKPSLENFEGKNDWHSKPRPAFRGHTIEHWRNLQSFCEMWAKECLRVLKPGAYLLSFGGTRTYHRMTCGIEDAGFEIRDCIMWLYGSGFPKSYNIGKGINKLLTQGNASWNGTGDSSNGALGYAKLQHEQGYRPNDYSNAHQTKTELTEKEAKEWEGWGTALKPACEPIVVARKPLSEKNVALNVLKWGTGGINIDECRIGTEEIISNHSRGSESAISKGIYGDSSEQKTHQTEGQQLGRFPANIILDEEAGTLLDSQTEGKVGNGHWSKTKTTGFGKFGNGKSEYFGVGEKDKVKGGASRFFYCAKASKSERNFGCEDLEEKYVRRDDGQLYGMNTNQFRPDGSERKEVPPKKNNHPTVKPIALMEYLIKLVSKEGAIILDPFAGSGTTGIACRKLNRKFILIEKEKDYINIIKKRLFKKPI